MTSLPFKQLHQPSTLTTLATSTILEWITLQASHIYQTDRPNNIAASEEYTSLKIKTIRDYFQNTPTIIMNALLEEFKAHLSVLVHKTNREMLRRGLGFSYKLHVISRMIEVLFTENITNFCIDYKEFECFRVSLRSKSHFLNKLETVKFIIELSPEEEEHFVIEPDIVRFLNGIPNLKHFITTCCNDNIINYTVDNLTSIEQLDLYNYYNASNETLDKLSHLPNLETIHLNETYTGFLLDSDLIGRNKRRIIEYIASKTQFEIKSYVFYNETTLEDLQSVIKKNPLIQSVSFVKTDGHSNLNCYLESIGGLLDLKELEIVNYDFDENLIKELIPIIGKKLQILKLRDVDEIDVEAIKTIGEMCPNLNTLIIKEAYRWVFEVRPLEKPLFANLRTFNLTFSGIITNSDPLEPTSNQLVLEFLIVNSPNIENIDIQYIEFTNDFLLKVLDKNPLKCLKELVLHSSLEKSVIDRLVKTGISPEVRYYNLDVLDVIKY